MQYRNDKGYPDPTAYEALKNIAREERMNRRKAMASHRCPKDKDHDIKQPIKPCRPTKAAVHAQKSTPRPQPAQWVKAWSRDSTIIMIDGTEAQK